MRDLEQTRERAEREIALMREYRTRLVADVVTGQLDVRDDVRHLPDDEPTPVDDTPDLDDDLTDDEPELDPDAEADA